LIRKEKGNKGKEREQDKERIEGRRREEDKKRRKGIKEKREKIRKGSTE
jgi:hypothetical protein